MNVLCLYPGMAKFKNEGFQVLVRLQEKGVKVAVVASQALQLKGRGRLSNYDDTDGVQVYRLYRSPLEMFVFPNRQLKKIVEVAEKLKPDLIFCSQELNMRLALLLKKLLKRPIVLLVEDAGSIASGKAYRAFRKRIMLECLGVPSAQHLWPWLNRKCSALITCHPRDRFCLKSLSGYGKPVYYVPWPSSIPEDFLPPTSRDRSRGVYVGSLQPFKNTREFGNTLPRIIKETPTKEFVVVGPGPDAVLVKRLEKKTHGIVRHLPELSRIEALRLIGSSFYAYTPTIEGGWGFMNDCWGMKTPVVLTHKNDFATDNETALVSENEGSLMQNINRLYAEPELYSLLQKNGYQESLRRRPEAVSTELCQIFVQTLKDLNEQN